MHLLFLIFRPCDGLLSKGFGGFFGLVEPLVDRCEKLLSGSVIGLVDPLVDRCEECLLEALVELSVWSLSRVSDAPGLLWDVGEVPSMMRP